MSETFNQVVQRWSDELVMYDEYDGDRLRKALATAGYRIVPDTWEWGVHVPALDAIGVEPLRAWDEADARDRAARYPDQPANVVRRHPATEWEDVL